MLKKDQNCVIAIDMGGTNIKFGIVTDDMELIEMSSEPASSDDDKETLLLRFCNIIKTQKNKIEDIGLRLCGIAISTPGPFDYDAGKSHMQGKYDSIFDIDLRKEFRIGAYLSDNIKIMFIQDAAAFLMGEYIVGNAKEYKNCSCVTLGTGVGYACMKNEKVLQNECDGPQYVFAFQNYCGETIENLISGRAINKKYNTDAKTLTQMAASGDNNAIKAFYHIGEVLGKGLLEVPETAEIDRLIIGGQVSFSFEFMKDGITKGLGKFGRHISTVRAKYPANAALYGSAYKLFKEEKYFIKGINGEI